MVTRVYNLTRSNESISKWRYWWFQLWSGVHFRPHVRDNPESTSCQWLEWYISQDESLSRFWRSPGYQNLMPHLLQTLIFCGRYCRDFSEEHRNTPFDGLTMGLRCCQNYLKTPQQLRCLGMYCRPHLPTTMVLLMVKFKLSPAVLLKLYSRYSPHWLIVATSQ